MQGCRRACVRSKLTGARAARERRLKRGAIYVGEIGYHRLNLIGPSLGRRRRWPRLSAMKFVIVCSYSRLCASRVQFCTKAKIYYSLWANTCHGCAYPRHSRRILVGQLQLLRLGPTMQPNQSRAGGRRNGP